MLKYFSLATFFHSHSMRQFYLNATYTSSTSICYQLRHIFVIQKDFLETFIFSLHSLCDTETWVFKKVFYLFTHERHREKGRDIGSRRSRLPGELGITRTLGSCPEPKADSQPLSHPSVLKQKVFKSIYDAIMKVLSQVISSYLIIREVSDFCCGSCYFVCFSYENFYSM